MQTSVTTTASCLAQLGFFETCTYRFAPELEHVAVALKKMEDNLLSRGVDLKTWNEVELATAEALNNAVEHGCQDAPSAFVELSWHIAGSSLEVEVSDASEQVLPPVDAALPEDPWQEEGRGHFLMAQMMQSVHHLTTPQRHIVRMTKELPSALVGGSSMMEMQQMTQALTEELSRNYEAITTLLKFSEILATSSQFTGFADQALAHLQAFMAADQVFIRIANDQRQLELIPTQTLHALGKQSLLALDTFCVETDVFQRVREATLEDMSQLPEEDPLRGQAKYAFVTPIFFQNRALGVLVILAKKLDEYFNATQTHLARVTAEFLGIAYMTSQLQEERKRQLRAMQELGIAAEIQQSLLPREFPQTAHYRIFGLSQPAQQVGGDYFDVIQLPDGQGTFLLIADVMGKGLPAALLATVLRTAIHAHLEKLHDPARLLQAIHLQIFPDLARLDMFITAQAAYINYSDNQLSFASAGHCPLIRYNVKQALVETLSPNGLPMGVDKTEVYTNTRVQIQSGDRFVLITDGLYEVTSLKGESLEVEGLCKQIPKLWTDTPLGFCSNILSYVQDYSDNLPASDDRTLIALEYLA